MNNDLKLDDEDLYSINGTNKTFYYDQLSDIAKLIYDKIVENRKEILTGTAEIKLDDPVFDDLLLQDDGMEKLRDEYQNAVDSLRYDDVTWFYIDFTKMALKTTTYTRGDFKWFDISLGVTEGKQNYFQEGFDADSAKKITNQIEKEKNKIIKDAKGTDYQKIRYVHDWLVDNLEYDESLNIANNRNIYGGLIGKKTVCEGYAKTFKYLLDELDIPCILVTGTATNAEGKEENHMWNYVEILGTWYSFDVTWDDPILVNGGDLSNEGRYKYFAQGDNINSNHTISYTITENGMEYEFPEIYHKEQ